MKNPLVSLLFIYSTQIFWNHCVLSNKVNLLRLCHKSIVGTIAVCSLGIGTHFALPVLAASECQTETNTQTGTTVVSCRKIGLVDDDGIPRLRGCNANQNCFSTSAKSAAKRLEPWVYKEKNENDAFSVLRVAIESQKLTLLQIDPIKLYILAVEKDVPKQPQGSSLYYEFLVRPSDKVVLYRGLVDKTVFVYPLQQPVSDFGAIKSKLDSIFSRTGFSKPVFEPDLIR